MEFFLWVFLWGTLLYLPFFITLTPFPALLFEAPLQIWYLSFVSGLIQTIYFICLIEAYRTGDLSFVYPVSRSSPLITVLWASLFIGEILSSTGVVGVGLVTLGIFLISIRDIQLKRPLSRPGDLSLRPYLLSVIAALLGSIYPVVDKRMVQILHPVFYTWLINFWMTIFVGVYLLRWRKASFSRVWAESKKEIFTIVFLQNIGYGCFLMALGMSKVSYTMAFRQMSVLFGALMGTLFLKESHWKTRIIGASILAVGLVLIGTAK